MDAANRRRSGSSSRKRRRGRGGDVRPWSDIPSDIICNVLRRLTIRDFVRCGAVCASWRSAMLQQHCRPMLEPPWVILYSRHGNSVRVICPPERQLRSVPKMPRKMICSSLYIGTSNGWIGLQRMESVHILHLLSGDIFQLPDLTTIPGVEAITDYDGTGRWPGLTYSFPFSSDNTTKRYALKSEGEAFFDDIFIVPPLAGGDRDELIIFVVHFPGLLFARPGDVAWSFVGMPAPVSNRVYSVSRHRGSIYAVDCVGRVAAWDYNCSRGSAQADAANLASGPQFTRIVMSSGPPPPTSLFVWRYLVEETNGDLLQVERDTDVEYNMIGVRVFRLEQQSGGEGEGRLGWRRLQHLGPDGKAVFVAYGVFAAFLCSDFPWLQRNCIYFTDGIYNMRTQKMRRFPERCFHWYCGNWFDPALRSPPAAKPLKA